MTVLFRCDATANTGHGHLGRCIALAEGLAKQGISASFAGDFDATAQSIVEIAGFPSVRIEHDDAFVPERSTTFMRHLAQSSIVIVDSYKADESYLAKLNELAPLVGCVDDFCQLPSYPCDLVLNFTWGASAFDYGPRPAKLLGPAFFPARAALIEGRAQCLGRDRAAPIRSLLIAIGGHDPCRIAGRVTDILVSLACDFSLRVVSAPDAELDHALSSFAPGSERVYGLPSLAKEFLRADAIVAGGGMIKYEAAFLGLPIATIAQNHGQYAETATLADKGVVCDLGQADRVSNAQVQEALQAFLNDHSGRSRMAANAAALFPDDPAANAAKAVCKLIGQQE